MNGLCKRRRTSAILFAIAVIVAETRARAAEVIQFPDEELASESVLPVFDQPDSVRNRNVLMAKRTEIGVVGGLSLLEPFFNPYSLGLTGSYHFNEERGIEVLGLYYMQGLSNNAQGLNPIPGTSPAENANLQYAPAPKYLLAANYQHTGFYGKVSLAKDFVMHLNIYGLFGAGVIGVGDSTNPLLNAGIGQKMYFSPNFALRVDFRFLVYQGPDVLSKKLNTATSERPASEFGQKINYASLLSAGVVFFFPGM